MSASAGLPGGMAGEGGPGRSRGTLWARPGCRVPVLGHVLNCQRLLSTGVTASDAGFRKVRLTDG